MKVKTKTARKPRGLSHRRARLRVSKEVLAFFPKTSQMGRADPSQWGHGTTSRKSDDTRVPVFSSSQI
jgi:hypothetical protein